MSETRYQVTDLGTLGGSESQADKINDVCQIIGCSDKKAKAKSGGLQTPFLWENGSFKSLGGFAARDINNLGEMVGTHLDIYDGHLIPLEQKPYALIYLRNKVRKLLPKFPYPNHAVAISDNGDVLGAWFRGERDPATGAVTFDSSIFIWNSGAMREIWHSYDNLRAIPVDINNAGEVLVNLKNVAGQDASRNERAVLWRGEETVELGVLPDFPSSKAVAINNKSQVLCKAIWHASSNEIRKGAPSGIAFRQKGYLWEDGKRSPIEAIVDDLNDQGQVVGGKGCFIGANTGPSYAFLWQDGEMFNLNDLISPGSGWDLARAKGINNLGQIVGYGEHNGVTRAFLLTPV